MPAPLRPDAMMLAYAAAWQLPNATKISAAGAVGLARGSAHSIYDDAIARGFIKPLEWTPPGVVIPFAEPLPDPRMPVADLIAHRRRAFAAKKAHGAAKLWRRFKIPVHGPYALMFFGDPHLDDDGCDIETFEKHIDLAASTEALFAINIGDTTNNWAGRLARLWANQDASAETARALVKHYLGERGVPWFLWLHGNHDMWDGPVGRDVFKRYRPEFVAMEDWTAKVTLVAPNGHETRLWASHNFKGHSLWNNMHGLLRAAQMEDWAHIYVAGHHHDCGLAQVEVAHRRFVANLMRVRGYKFLDEYAQVNQFSEYQYGMAGVAVVDPDADKLNAVTCFLDPFEAVDLLAFKRRKMAA